FRATASGCLFGRGYSGGLRLVSGDYVPFGAGYHGAQGGIVDRFFEEVDRPVDVQELAATGVIATEGAEFSVRYFHFFTCRARKLAIPRLPPRVVGPFPIDVAPRKRPVALGQCVVAPFYLVRSFVTVCPYGLLRAVVNFSHHKGLRRPVGEVTEIERVFVSR